MTCVNKSGVTLTELSDLGAELAPLLFYGAFIALYGDLGAGKTTFVRAVAEAMHMENITSPTFTIVCEHEGSLPLLHFDAYRLGSAEELYAIGFSDYLARNAVIMMEWCENVPEALPAERLDITICGSGDLPRNISFLAHGPRYEAMLEALK